MHRIRALLTLFLTCALLSGPVMPAVAVTQAEADQHAVKAAQAREAAAALEKQAADLKAQTAELDTRIDQLQAEADKLEPQIDEATAVTRRLSAEVADLDQDVVELTEEIEATQAEYDRQQALLADRVESTYKQGTWFYLDVLLGSSDISDFIARSDLVNRVIESNNNVAAALDDTKTRLASSRVALQRSLDTMKLKQAEAKKVEGELRDLQDARQAKTDEQKAVFEQKSAMMEESSANAQRLLAIAQAEEAESAAIERQLAARGGRGSGQYAGTMAWPVPGFSRVTSPFGYRIHPIFGTRKLHTGIDIGRNSDGTSINGAAIVAVGDGTVIEAGYHGGYGNTIMIDHGNGVVSLYAHQQSGGLKVSVGESVSAGQRIGTVGSTGYSTGPHLHFEVRVNGAPTDPMNYL